MLLTSPNDTAIMPAADFFGIVDARHNFWYITPTGQVTINDVIDQSTANVIELAYVNGQIWQENNQGLWWEKTTTAQGQWNPEGGINPLTGATFNLGVGAWPAYAGPQPPTISLNNIFAYSFSAVPAYHLQYIPPFTQTGTNAVTLWHENYEIQGYGTTDLLIHGNSSIAGGSTLRLDGTTHSDSPMPLVNDGVMYVSGSTLFAGSLSGNGAIVASSGSVLDMDSATVGETIQLNSSHLYIGGAQSIGHPPNQGQSFGMSFLAPITNFRIGDSITLDFTTATSEIFAKTSLTSGDLMLFNGTTQVADLHISGSANIYAQDIPGTSMMGPSVLLTASNPGVHIPIVS